MSEPTEKKGDVTFLVTRKIPLVPVPAEKLEDAIRQLMAIEPVIGARMGKRNRLHVSYDASCVSIGDIEALLNDSGIARESGFAWYLKSAWYGFLDENAKSNARSTGGACCNRLPSGANSDAGKIR